MIVYRFRANIGCLLDIFVLEWQQHESRTGEEIEETMQVSVKLGEPLWRQVGKRTLQLEWDQRSVTVADMLRHLEAEYPGFGPVFRGEGFNAAHPYSLFVNARLARLKQAKTTSLRDGDKLFVFIPVVGG